MVSALESDASAIHTRCRCRLTIPAIGGQVCRRSLMLAIASLTLLLPLAGTPSLAAERGVSWTTRFLAADGTELQNVAELDLTELTFVVIHGFRCRGTNPEFLRQARAVQNRFPRSNVVVVDWCVAAQQNADQRSIGIPALDRLLVVPSEYQHVCAAAEGIRGTYTASTMSVANSSS